MSAIFDVTDAFTPFLQIFTGSRYVGEYVGGRWVDDAPVAIEFDAVIQNATPQDLKILPEGNRFEEVISIHTTFELIMQVEDTYIGDIVNYNSAQWRVIHLANRVILGKYYQALAVRQQ